MAPEVDSENIYNLTNNAPKGENIYNLASRLERPDSKASLYGLELNKSKNFNDGMNLVSNERHKQRNLSTLDKDHMTMLPALLKY